MTSLIWFEARLFSLGQSLYFVLPRMPRPFRVFPVPVNVVKRNGFFSLLSHNLEPECRSAMFMYMRSQTVSIISIPLARDVSEIENIRPTKLIENSFTVVLASALLPRQHSGPTPRISGIDHNVLFTY